jgi:hypothetical protein
VIRQGNYFTIVTDGKKLDTDGKTRLNIVIAVHMEGDVVMGINGLLEVLK